MEKRLIDANAISNGIALYLAENAYLNDTAQGTLEMVAMWVNNAPTVDAVEVVRCKDCRYCQQDANGLWCFNDYEHDLQPDDFCSYGERRTDNA